MTNKLGFLLLIITVFLLFIWLYFLSKIILGIKKVQKEKQSQTLLKRKVRYFSSITILGIALLFFLWSLTSRYSLRFSDNKEIILFRVAPNADFSKKKLSEKDFQFAILTSANFREAELINSNFEEANLSRANLEKANLSKANLESANLSRANLESANLTRANLSKANLESANLENANLSRANLEGANLTRTNLEGANLGEVKLKRANLEGANLTRVNFEMAELNNTSLQAALTICNTILHNGEISDRNCPNLKYTVGVFGLRDETKREEFSNVRNWLREQGYTITGTLLESRPSWLSYQSAVFYYSNESRDRANTIAEKVSTIINQVINPTLVAPELSVGVPKGREKFFFYIHIL
ncbi:MAG: pentapeptide repeat-containing protein [Prochloraceae cyanobacterium]